MAFILKQLMQLLYVSHLSCAVSEVPGVGVLGAGVAGTGVNVNLLLAFLATQYRLCIFMFASPLCEKWNRDTFVLR